MIACEWRGPFASSEVSAWLHVNFEEHLQPFYLRGCGFTPSAAGLIAL